MKPWVMIVIGLLIFGALHILIQDEMFAFGFGSATILYIGGYAYLVMFKREPIKFEEEEECRKHLT